MFVFRYFLHVELLFPDLFLLGLFFLEELLFLEVLLEQEFDLLAENAIIDLYAVDDLV